jgi:hypothetical protein
MTWQKLGMEFWDECADAALSDAAVRTHGEAIGYVYSQENFDMTVKKSTMRRWAGSDQAEQAASELVAKGFWTDSKTEWTVVHHANVVRQSLTAQLKKREDDKERQRKNRSKVGTDVGSAVHATQTDRQTDKQPKRQGSSEERIDWVTGEVTHNPDGVCNHPLTSAVQRQHGMCNRCWVTANAQRSRASS